MNGGLVKVNVGCGASPTPGYVNFDNSLSVRIASSRALRLLARRIPILDTAQSSFVQEAAKHGVRWAQASRLPLKNGSAEIVYSSHMLEHLPRVEARSFLQEAYRVLAPQGWIRIAVPDLKLCARDYMNGALTADEFVDKTFLAAGNAAGLKARILDLVRGNRHHLWMYDALSLSQLLRDVGFVDVAESPAGHSRLPSPGELDLNERSDESVYVEAMKPHQ